MPSKDKTKTSSSSKEAKKKKKEKEKEKEKDSSSSKKDKENSEVEVNGEQPRAPAMDYGPFQNGVMFARYCDQGSNVISMDNFLKMVRDLNLSLPAHVPESSDLKKVLERKQFEAGMLFAKYDKDNRGVVDKEAFQEMYREMLESGKKSSTTSHKDAHIGTADFPYASLHGDGLTYAHPKQGFVTVSYNSPLPHLSSLPTELDDTSTAMLRRDFLHLQSLLEATLAPRIENEVRMLEKVEETKRAIRDRASKIERDSRLEFDAILKRLKEAADKKCSDADKVASAHRKVLEKISQFQYLAAGPRPRDALRIDTLPTSQYGGPSFLGPNTSCSTTDVTPEDPMLTMFKRQRERAQAAFQEQEKFPHPVVMRDFVNLFNDFQTAAQKLVDMPYSSVPENILQQAVKDGMYSDGKGSIEKLQHILDHEHGNDLPKEVLANKDKALETDKLREDLKLKDQMIWSMVQERESFEQQKFDLLKQVDELSKAAATEIRAWAELHEKTTNDLNAKIARLQEQNRILEMQLN